MDLGRVLDNSERGAPSQPPQRPQGYYAREPLGRPIYEPQPGYGPSTPTSHAIPTASALPASGEVWVGAIARLQSQVSLNTSMLESHRRQIAGIEQAVVRLQQEMANVMAAIHETRAELQTRPVITSQWREGGGDVEVLASQLAVVNSKVHEMDSVKMQLETMSNRLRSLEQQSTRLTRRTGTTVLQDPYEPASAPSGLPSQVQPTLPPMRMMPPESPVRHHQGMPMAPVSSAQEAQTSLQHMETPARVAEPVYYAQPQVPGFRPAQPGAPPTPGSSWHTASSYQAAPPVLQPSPANVPYRPQAYEGAGPGAGWAAVNQPRKRSMDEQLLSAYGQSTSAPGSPKRPRLAPIVPRGAYGEDYVQSPLGLPSSTSMHAPEGPLARTRAHSDAIRQSSHPMPSPVSIAPGVYRFVPSATDPEGRPIFEAEHAAPRHEESPGSSRGRGRGGRGRGGRGKSSKSSSGHSLDEQHEVGAPGSRENAEGYYDPAYAARAGTVYEHHDPHDYPATPIGGQAQDDYATHQDMIMGSSGKKSRTKPIRNADGVLIRKDGRPDMRSVSSANNLRKVHAKREAERAEADGKTPTSMRSLAAAHSNSMSSEDREERSGTPHSGAGSSPMPEGHEPDEIKERHRELASRPSSRDTNADDNRSLASTYFPRREDMKPILAGAPKAEDAEHRGSSLPHQANLEPSAITASSDVVMQDADVAQPAEPTVTKMEPIAEQPENEQAAESEDSAPPATEQTQAVE
ncbi:hypothetical protein LTR86_005330 [Recurvomyces mirabilis]|nr:hypothetical protein LTR86_005330 [Recurvomyces mirabilis]